MAKNPKNTQPTSDPLIDALSDQLMESGAGIDIVHDADFAVDAPRPQLASSLTREFRCMECGNPFSREDCKSDAKGVFASIRRCPFCKSERVIRQVESNWAAERKYDVSIEEATLGPKPGKYAGLAAKKGFQSGKIKRRKA
jgi:hypothetical protein